MVRVGVRDRVWRRLRVRVRVGVRVRVSIRVRVTVTVTAQTRPPRACRACGHGG